jgi:phosphatidylserine/phosphatidylglycerophosphate/cardiolipin synthase-like enzyme
MRWLAVLFLGSVVLPLSALDYDLGFSPGGTALKTVVTAIEGAKENIVVAAYEFTSADVAQALSAAAARGVKVWAVLDEKASKERASQSRWLASHGIGVRINGHYAIFHHKFMVIDRRTVETGSFNYTGSADQRNAENALVLRGVPELAEAYLKEWKRLWDEAQPLPGL